MSSSSGRILCIDTSGAATMTLIEPVTYQVVAQSQELNARRHAESLGAMLQEVAGASPRTAGIQRICVGTGPGPFTGLRAGLAFAAALGQGLNVQVMGAPSQHALARAALDKAGIEGLAPRVLVTSDAKRGEVYWGIYEEDGADDVTALTGPNVGTLEEAQAAAAELGAIQVEVEANPSILARLIDARLAKTVEEGGGRKQFALDPLYLRRPDVHVKKNTASAPQS